MGELGLAVGPKVLITETARDLVVTLDTRDHQKLLEQLRRLWQGVALARLQTRRNQEITGAFGSGSGQLRCLDVQEAVVFHHPTDDGDHLRTDLQVFRHAGAAQIDVPVLEPQVFRDVNAVLNRKRRGLCLRKHLNRGSRHFDRASVKTIVAHPFGAHPDLTGHADHPFGAHTMRGFQRRSSLRVGDHLHDPRAITQVQERDPAMVTSGIDPTSQRDGLPVVFSAQSAVAMGAHCAKGGDAHVKLVSVR